MNRINENKQRHNDTLVDLNEPFTNDFLILIIKIIMMKVPRAKLKITKEKSCPQK